MGKHVFATAEVRGKKTAEVQKMTVPEFQNLR
jgi:hypothetical protein